MVDTPEARWWVPVDDAGREITARQPYYPIARWRCTVEEVGRRIRGLGFAETEDGPLLLTIPVRYPLTVGDEVFVAGPASSGRIPLGYS